ncbi:hypothetical protein P3T76_006061 [Phytophthora citrophthora]|uniref:C1q domain-containing protein n=1 Tax=Phytophthora citrophthora TaxID=4793 RepID=A0AAD9LPB9_9STRA|nr:hypothetical protein P3T76_006061 [Phytophthora citrophthora]
MKCFKQCLNSPLGEDEDVKRTLLPQNGGKMKLDLSLKIRLLLFARNIHYIFELNPIAVERIDILESKMKDLQEEVQRGNKSSVGTTAFLFVDSEVMTDSKLQWKETTANSFAFNEDNTSIKILVPGVYAIGLVVNHTLVANASQGKISLLVNDETIQTTATSSSYYSSGVWKYTSHPTSSSLMCVISVGKEAKLSVVCTNTSTISNMPSYLTVARIGR